MQHPKAGWNTQHPCLGKSTLVKSINQRIVKERGRGSETSLNSVLFSEQLIISAKDYTIGELLLLLYLIVKSRLNNINVKTSWGK